MSTAKLTLSFILMIHIAGHRLLENSRHRWVCLDDVYVKYMYDEELSFIFTTFARIFQSVVFLNIYLKNIFTPPFAFFLFLTNMLKLQIKCYKIKLYPFR